VRTGTSSSTRAVRVAVVTVSLARTTGEALVVAASGGGAGAAVV